MTVQTIVPDATESVENINDALSRAHKCLRPAQARMNNLADTNRKDMECAIGQQVLLSTKYLLVHDGMRKLAHKWIRPSPIFRRIGKTDYELDLPKSMPSNLCEVYHISILKLYTCQPTLPLPVPNFQGTELD